MNATKLTAARRKVNAKFTALCREYHDGIPTTKINSILSGEGMSLEDGIYTGRQGESFEPVGLGQFLRLSWYKMESGRFEIVCYIS